MDLLWWLVAAGAAAIGTAIAVKIISRAKVKRHLSLMEDAIKAKVKKRIDNGEVLSLHVWDEYGESYSVRLDAWELDGDKFADDLTAGTVLYC